MHTARSNRLRLLCMACFLVLLGTIGVHTLTDRALALRLALVVLPIGGVVLGAQLMTEATTTVSWCLGLVTAISATVATWHAITVGNPFAHQLVAGLLLCGIVGYKLTESIHRIAMQLQ